MNELSRRLQTVAALCKPTEVIADIGCDHGYMAIHLVRSGICQRAVASDVNDGPLQRAREHVDEAGLSDRIDLRKSDGLEAYQPGEVTAMVAAGMGGPLMRDILIRGRDKVCGMDYLVLQPQSEIPEFRSFLKKAGFSFEDESLTEDAGKYYPMMRLIPPGDSKRIDRTSCPEAGSVFSAEEIYGPVLLKVRPAILTEYLKKEKQRVQSLLGAVPADKEERIRELRREEAMIDGLLQ